MRTGKNGIRRIAALICAAALAASLLPVQVLAVDEAPNTTVETLTPSSEDSGFGEGEKDSGTADTQQGNSQNKTPEEQQTESGNEDLNQEENKTTEGGEEELQKENQKDNETTGANPSGSEDSLSDEVTGAGEEVELDLTTLDNSLVSTLADGDVAKIGDVYYETLDEAVEAAQEGETIELLADATTNGLNIHKTLTIQAADQLSEKPTITFENYGIAIGYGDKGKSMELTLRNVNVNMQDIGMTPAYGEWNWQSICASSATFTLDNVTMVMDGENAEGAIGSDTGKPKTVHAIYLTNNCTLNLLNGTSLTIQNYDEDALEWDGGNSTYKVNIIDSTYISDGNRSGFTGTFLAEIDNSTVKVLNSTGNGSNGTYYTIKNNSNVEFDNNGSWGISAYKIDMTGNSVLTATDNAYSGVWVRILNVDSTCTLDVERNGYEGDWSLSKISGLNTGATSSAGITFWGNTTASCIESGAKVTIQDNAGSGIAGLQGVSNLTIGSATIVNNGKNSENLSEMYGGGIFTVGTIKLSGDVVIYNNHATTAGDDICFMPNQETRTLEFGQVGEDWLLDDCKDLDNCDAEGKINGWYDDSKDARWNAHDGDGVFHVVEFTDFNTDTGIATLTGNTNCTSLKAAHDAVTLVRPADITIYMGGDGYKGVVTDEDGNVLEGTDQTNSGLPEPGFYITLPDDINTALKQAGIATDGEGADLSKYLKIYTMSDDRSWNLQPYGKTYSGAYDRYIYRIVPAKDGQDKVRLEFTDENGNLHISDTFQPDTEGSLFQQYDMNLYAGEVNLNNVRIDITIPGENDEASTIYTCTMKNESGKLKIRYVTGDQDSVVTPVADTIENVEQEDGKAYAVVESDTRYLINGSEIDVTDEAAPSLLFDDVVDSKDTGENEDYGTQLKNHALTQIGTELQDPDYQAKYLDLVDANNGNVWLTADKPVTVYWPYPEGTDENTQFYLVHFKGMNREMDNDAISEAIEKAEVETLEIISTDEHGISFQTDSFSPFVLVWERPAHHDNPGTGTEQPQPTQTPKPTVAPAPTATPVAVTTGTIPQTGDTMPVGLLGGVTVLAAAALVALVVLRKRKHDD